MDIPVYKNLLNSNLNQVLLFKKYKIVFYTIKIKKCNKTKTPICCFVLLLSFVFNIKDASYQNPIIPITYISKKDEKFC